MEDPQEASTPSRRVRVRLRAQTDETYQEPARPLDVPLGRLLRQVLALEADERQALTAALQGRWQVAERLTRRRQRGGRTQRFRGELLRRQLEGWPWAPGPGRDRPAPTGDTPGAGESTNHG